MSKPTSSIQILEASTQELDELASFARSTYADAFSDDLGLAVLQQHLTLNMSDQQFAQMMQADTFYLARSNAQLVGFVQIGSVEQSYQAHLTNFDPGASEIRRLYVHKEFQSQGVGSTLIEWVLQDPVVLRSSNLYLTTWQDNNGAQKLYKKHQFELVGKIPEYGNDGDLNGYEFIMVRRN